MGYYEDNGYVPATDFISSATIKLGDSMSQQVEQRVQILVNPKPKKMKQETWEKMCKKVLTIAYHPLIMGDIKGDK